MVAGKKVYKVWKDGERTPMKYEQVCSDLCFRSDIGFVQITSAGTITFSIGKFEEIKALYGAIINKGYKSSKSCQRALECC